MTEERKITPSLFVCRNLHYRDHEPFLGHTTELEQHFPDAGLQWRPLGKASVLLVKRSEYRFLARKAPFSEPLADVEHVSNRLRQDVLDKGASLPVPLQPVTFLAAETLDQAWFGSTIEGCGLVQERHVILRALEEISGMRCNWPGFTPYLALGTVSRGGMTAPLREAIQDIMPPEVTLIKPRVFI